MIWRIVISVSAYAHRSHARRADPRLAFVRGQRLLFSAFFPALRPPHRAAAGIQVLLAHPCPAHAGHERYLASGLLELVGAIGGSRQCAQPLAWMKHLGIGHHRRTSIIGVAVLAAQPPRHPPAAAAAIIAGLRHCVSLLFPHHLQSPRMKSGVVRAPGLHMLGRMKRSFCFAARPPAAGVLASGVAARWMVEAAMYVFIALGEPARRGLFTPAARNPRHQRHHRSIM